MLQLKNDTPFAANIMLLPDADGIDTVYAVVKATFSLRNGVELADRQVPVALTDQHYGDPQTSSIRVPCDVSLGKRGTDVLVVGSAWAPGGQPVWQMDVSFTVGPIAKSLRVHGDRVWQESAGVSSIAWVAPFVRMPLVWERAYGGADETPSGPTARPDNPVGAGFRLPNGAKPLAGMPLPNVESVDRLVTQWRDTPAPSGCAAIAPHWEPRKSYAGTYDDAWQTSRAPYLPRDFDARFFQLAPTDQIAPAFFRGGEPVELHGLTPSGSQRFTLPAARVSVLYRLASGEEQREAVLDTVLVEPDDARLILVWRAALSCDKKTLTVKEVRTTVTS